MYCECESIKNFPVQETICDVGSSVCLHEGIIAVDVGNFLVLFQYERAHDVWLSFSEQKLRHNAGICMVFRLCESVHESLMHTCRQLVFDNTDNEISFLQCACVRVESATIDEPLASDSSDTGRGYLLRLLVNHTLEREVEVHLNDQAEIGLT